MTILPLYFHLTPYIKPLDSDNEITLNVSSEGDETHTLTVTLIPADHCPGAVMFILVFKQRSALFTSYFSGEVGHTKRLNHLYTNNKKLLFTVLILFTLPKRFANCIPDPFLQAVVCVCKLKTDLQAGSSQVEKCLQSFQPQCSQQKTR